MKKTYKVKNYKGNLVESLSKFQKSHKGMKIVEACEDGEDLKIKTEAAKNIKESEDFFDEVYKGGFTISYDETNGEVEAFEINTERDDYGDGEVQRDCIVAFFTKKEHLDNFFKMNELPKIELNTVWKLSPGKEYTIPGGGKIRRIF